MSECFIRGINIKYLRIPDEIIDKIKDDKGKKRRYESSGGRGGGRSDRGGGRGRGRGR